MSACSTASKQARFESCSVADSVESVSAFKTAFDNCRVEASEGDAVSQKNLGYMYYFGNQHMQKDIPESVKWFKRSAKQGNLVAQYRLDMMFGKMEFSQLTQ